jgi:glycosyltransferase involved in cell wall biosynthesis
MSSTSISVLIRNRNEADDLRRLLLRLREQQAQNIDIVVVDNESTDESRQHIESFGCRLVHLPEDQFTYGRATNLGLEHCSGELIVTLSSHSLPIGRSFIDEVTAPFSDPRVAAVRIPIASNTAELKNLGTFAPLHSKSGVEEVFRRGPVASGSVLRRSIWLAHRFDETLPGAEDKEWAFRVLGAGDYIMPVANAAYCYTRSFPPEKWIQKIRREEIAGFQAAGIRPRPSLKDTVFSILAAQRDVFRKAFLEAQLYWFRTRLGRTSAASETKSAGMREMAVSGRRGA